MEKKSNTTCLNLPESEQLFNKDNKQKRTSNEKRKRVVKSNSINLPSRSDRNGASKPARRSTSIIDSQSTTYKESKEFDMLERSSSLQEFLKAESRQKQLAKELQKHSLSDEEMNLLMLDIVQPLDVFGLILKNK
jgi:hypothetical protein